VAAVIQLALEVGTFLSELGRRKLLNFAAFLATIGLIHRKQARITKHLRDEDCPGS